MQGTLIAESVYAPVDTLGGQPVPKKRKFDPEQGQVNIKLTGARWQRFFKEAERRGLDYANFARMILFGYLDDLDRQQGAEGSDSPRGGKK